MTRRNCVPALLLGIFLYASAEEPGISAMGSMDYAGNGFNQGNIRGQLRPVHHTVLSSGISAKLISFPVERGEMIEKGQQIAVFDCGVQEANLKISRTRQEAAGNRLLVNQKLQQFKNISSLDLSLSQSELAITKAEVERALAIVDECEVHAPFSGAVVEKYAQAFQYVEIGEPLIELVDTSVLEIEMVLPSLQYRNYQPGAMFSILIDETGQSLAASIDRTVGVVDPVSQTIRVIGKLINTPPNLLPGMSGVVDLTSQ